MNGCGRQPRVNPPEAGLENVDEEDVVVEGIGPRDVGPVEVIVSEGVDHVLDDGLLEELLVEGNCGCGVNFVRLSTHAAVLPEWHVSGNWPLRGGTPWAGPDISRTNSP